MVSSFALGQIHEWCDQGDKVRNNWPTLRLTGHPFWFGLQGILQHGTLVADCLNGAIPILDRAASQRAFLLIDN